ncbi:hypothetical protein TNCV_4279901 [Trichonephila clavipes]|nr:hypothetical protein TNCV_4279901 [Trichonephila clavipes]
MDIDAEVIDGGKKVQLLGSTKTGAPTGKRLTQLLHVQFSAGHSRMTFTPSVALPGVKNLWTYFALSAQEHLSPPPNSEF